MKKQREKLASVVLFWICALERVATKKWDLFFCCFLLLLYCSFCYYYFPVLAGLIFFLVLFRQFCRCLKRWSLGKKQTFETCAVLAKSFFFFFLVLFTLFHFFFLFCNNCCRLLFKEGGRERERAETFCLVSRKTRLMSESFWFLLWIRLVRNENVGDGNKTPVSVFFPSTISHVSSP